MHIAICDDNQTDRNVLIGFCKQYAQDRSVILEVAVFENSASLLADDLMLDAGAVFLDIQMEAPGSGVETARALRQRGYKGALLFVTVSTDFYTEGFEVGALHYLVKPVRYEDFAEAMNRAMHAIGAFERYIIVTSGRRKINIPLRHILHATVEKHKTILYTTAGKIPVNISLSQTEALLSDPRFLKCYRSCVVNMEQVARVRENDFLLKSGEHVPIATRLATQIKDHYMRYIFEAGKRHP